MCGRPPTQNQRRRQHWSRQSKSARVWKHAGAVLARAHRIPTLTAVTVECWGRYPDRRSLPDPDGLAPGLKAVLDGIVQAGVIPDDTPAHVRGVTYLPAVIAPGPPGLIVRITETIGAVA